MHRTLKEFVNITKIILIYFTEVNYYKAYILIYVINILLIYYLLLILYVTKVVFGVNYIFV